MYELVRYQTEEGVQPLTDWLASIADTRARAKLGLRLRKVEAGSLGDCRSVGEGVMELREHSGPGWRVYFGRRGQTSVVLLAGGTKRTQVHDIASAKSYWADWKRRQQ